MRTIFLSISVFAAAVVFCQPVLAQTERTQQERPQIKISPQTSQVQGEVVTITGKHRSLTVPPLRIPAQLKTAMVMEPRQSRKPQALSLEMKRHLTKGKGALGPYATLSLNNLSVVGRAEALFSFPVFVFTGKEGPLVQLGVNPSLLSLRINAESANSLYLVDCSVDTPNPDATFYATENVETEIGSVGQSQPIKVINGHLVFLLNAPDAGWYDLAVETNDTGWYFYSCTVSSLK